MSAQSKAGRLRTAALELLAHHERSAPEFPQPKDALRLLARERGELRGKRQVFPPRLVAVELALPLDAWHWLRWMAQAQETE
jgi:hypothetical protein